MAKESLKKFAKSVTENSTSFYAYTRSKAKTKDTVGTLNDKNEKWVTEETVYICKNFNVLISILK